MNFVWSLSIFGYMIIVFVPLFHPIVIVHVVFPAVLTFILLTMLVFCHLRFPFGTDAACVVVQLDWLWQCCLLLCFFFFFLIIPSHTRLILYYLRHVILSSLKIELREETNTFMSRSYYRSYILTPFVIVVVIAINNVLLILGVCIIVDIYTFLSLMKMTLSPSFFPSLIMHASF